MSETEIQLERLRSPEVRDRVRGGWTTILFACGAVEQHGPHLPLFMDAEHGTRLAREVARRLGRVLVAPTLRIGCSEHHMAFPGTLSLRRETFEAMVTDYVTSCTRHGFKRILIVPTHGGNFAPLSEMLPRLRAAAVQARVEAYTDLVGMIRIWRRVAEEELGLGARVGGHADLAETSIMLSLHPDLVEMHEAAVGYRSELSDQVLEKIIHDGLESVTPNGILGDARGARAELGEELISSVADEIASFFGRSGSKQLAK